MNTLIVKRDKLFKTLL